MKKKKPTRSPHSFAIWFHAEKHPDVRKQIDQLRLTMAVELGRPLAPGDVVAELVRAKFESEQATPRIRG